MKSIITATKARESFFEILNRVLYGKETIFITKAGADKNVVKLERVPESRSILNKLAGSISDADAKTMLTSISKSRKTAKR